MNKLRILGGCALIGGAAVLSGCVAYPANGYDNYGSYPYYSAPAPSVYIEGGSYYDGHPGYYGRPYYGRPGYYDPRPGYPRPGWNGGGGRPGWQGNGQGPRPPVGVPRPPVREAPLAGSVMRPPPGGRVRDQPPPGDRP